MFFKTDDHEEELLRRHFTAQGLSGSAMDAALEAARDKLATGYPLAYLIGEQAFYNLVLFVNEDVLIPRPDTERVVERALPLLPYGGRFADLGTGSGAIALALAYNRPDVTGVGVDLSRPALAVAEKNAAAYGLSHRLTFCRGDLFGSPLGRATFDLILSNPPYIPTGDIAAYPSLAFEPLSALDGGQDGLRFYRHILSSYGENLSPEGAFVFEIGFDQRTAVLALGAEAGYAGEVFRDYGGNDRVAVFRKRNI